MTAIDDRYRTTDIAVRGGNLRVGIWSPAEGADAEPARRLLAVHGITASHLCWQWLAAALPHWLIVAPDLRGRGRSNHLPGPYGMPTHAEDLAAVWDQLELGPVTVMGHSMGGFAALALADQHPDLVDRLVLIDGGLPLQLPDDMSPDDAVGAMLGPAAQRLSMEFASVEKYAEFWRQHPAFRTAWGPELDAYLAYDLVGEPPHLRPATRYEAMVGDSRDLFEGDRWMTARAGRHYPTVFLRAERGLLDDAAAFYSADWVAAWAAQVPGLTAIEMPDINHYTLVMSADGAARVAAVVA